MIENSIPHLEYSLFFSQAIFTKYTLQKPHIYHPTFRLFILVNTG